MGYKQEASTEILAYVSQWRSQVWHMRSTKMIQEAAVLHGPKDGKITAIMAMKKGCSTS